MVFNALCLQGYSSVVHFLIGNILVEARIEEAHGVFS